jgi:hypothetical protein
LPAPQPRSASDDTYPLCRPPFSVVGLTSRSPACARVPRPCPQCERPVPKGTGLPNARRPRCHPSWFLRRPQEPGGQKTDYRRENETSGGRVASLTLSRYGIPNIGDPIPPPGNGGEPARATTARSRFTPQLPGPFNSLVSTGFPPWGPQEPPSSGAPSLPALCAFAWPPTSPVRRLCLYVADFDHNTTF